MADDDNIWGESSDDYTPNNPFGIQPDEEDETPEVEAEEEAKEPEAEEEPDDEKEPEEEEEDPEAVKQWEYNDPDAIEPVVVDGRTYTSLAALTQALATAQDHINRTAREDRTPLREALTGVGTPSWESDWKALAPTDQALLQQKFEEDPGALARQLASDIRIVGQPITELVFNEWAKIEPVKAMNWAFEQRAMVDAQNAPEQAPQQNDPYVQNYIDEQQSNAAEQILQQNIHGWTPEVAEEVAGFIMEYGEQLGLADADTETPEGMAQFVSSVYYYMQGLKADQAMQQEATPVAKTTKKRGYSPVKSAASSSSTTGDPELDDIFGAPEEGFTLPKLPKSK